MVHELDLAWALANTAAVYLDGIIKLSEVGTVANHISLMRHI